MEYVLKNNPQADTRVRLMRDGYSTRRSGSLPVVIRLLTRFFLLALMCGLRKSEIDTLLWTAFDFDNARLMVRPNDYTELKSVESAGDIDLDPDLNRMFQEFARTSLSEFVVESRAYAEASERKTSYRAHRSLNILQDG